ncbi:MAG TPA: hypothetical protein VFI41_04625 [Gemmatimonadales bacterium]|nr:hypothetical protein [Gemmatimonadales bacterium]
MPAEPTRDADPVRRGWLHIATTDTAMREQLRHIDTVMFGVSALDMLDGLISIIDKQERLIDGGGS